VSSEGHLDWEARRAPAAAAAAFGAGLLTIVSLVLQIALIGQPADDDRGALVRIDENAAELFGSLATQVLSLALLALALLYLLRATIARRPEVPRFIMPLLPLGPVLLGVGGLLTQIDLGDIADRFTSLPADARTNPRAESLLEDRNIAGGIVASAGTLCLALSFVFVSLNAMRAGLLSRFMGIIGIVVGALLVLPLVPGGQSFIQLYWIVALGLLFLGRWPGGRGPAWRVSEAIPWPSAQQRRDEVAAGALPVDDPRDPPPEPSAEPGVDANGDGEAQREPHPVSRKKSRKRRR
jgi:hypothetical protein